MSANKKPDRRILHCPLCVKATETLATHLARVCMKDKSPEERQAELQRAKDSTKLWTQQGRVWDYRELFRLCPHAPSRRALIQQMMKREFLIQNLPPDFDDAEDVATVVQAGAEKPSTSAEDSSSDVPSQPEAERDPTRQRPPPQSSTTLRERMQQENLYAKFPPETPLLLEFKHHLSSILQIPNCQQEVDNVSRVLRYVQPTGDDIKLTFMDNTTLVGEYFIKLKNVGQSPATRINYIKSLIQFIKFLRLSRGATDAAVIPKCIYFMDYLTVLRKPISKSHSEDLCGKRHGYFVGPKKRVHELCLVLRVAKKDTLGMLGRLLRGEDVTDEEKTRYRYYCEAILIFGHYQWPGVVEGLAVSEWVQRQSVNGRVVVAVKSHRTANSQVAQFALTEEEAAFINQYYVSIRPDYIRDDMDEDTGEEKLFLAKNGKAISSTTNDMRRLHEFYKCPNVTSQEIRRAMETECAANLTDEQKSGKAHYLGHTDKVAQAHYRMRGPVRFVNMANVLQLGTEGTSDESEEDRWASRKRPRPAETFGSFEQSFPVTLNGKPPNKVSRQEAGFSEDRSLYDRWRAQQFKMRETHLLGQWTRRPPTKGKVQRIIEKEQWHSNCPSAKSIIEKWQPPKKEGVESNPKMKRLVETQKWKYLVVVEPSPKAGKGKGVVITKNFPKNAILCDYHGEVISAAEGRKRMASKTDGMGYVFFFKDRNEDLCVDASNTSCPCHPDMETFGRLINHSKKRPNVRPVACRMDFPEGARVVIFFRAMRDLAVNEELLFDYGVPRDSFGGEGRELTWLDD
ncbi:uncharacterized protein LOC144986865 isoform X2 [Oryzias latipes]